VIARFVDIGGIVDHHMLSFIFHIDRHFLRNVYFSIYLQYVVPTFESNILCLNSLVQIASRNKRRNVQTFNREFRGLKSSLDPLVPTEEHDYVLSDIFENSIMDPVAVFVTMAYKKVEFEIL
jgi:hypothetical protein